MKRCLLPVLLFAFFAFAALGAESRLAPRRGPGPEQGRQLQTIDPAAGPSDFPTISQFQMPRIVPTVGCGGGEGGDPCQNDWGDGGGGYTIGGCNCNRNCDTVSCKPVTNNTCKSPATGGGCEECVNPNC